jgi:hypothetical protein
MIDIDHPWHTVALALQSFAKETLGRFSIALIGERSFNSSVTCRSSECFRIECKLL